MEQKIQELLIFDGWYSDKNVSVSIIGENGEVTTNETVYAKWLQFRYLGYNCVETNWTPWKKMDE